MSFQFNFLGTNDIFSRLDKGNDPLFKLSRMIDFEAFRLILKPVTFDIGLKGGRPPLDVILLFKGLILASLYNLSDDALEYGINDRASFKRFLGLELEAKSPDAKTFWVFRERLKEEKLEETLFSQFLSMIDAAGFEAKNGQMIDASFVEVHKPSGRLKKQIEAGKPLKPAQQRQKDEDATFTKKRGESFHGYKDHIQADNAHKIIRKMSVTTASTHDSQEFDALFDDSRKGDCVYADSAYRSQEREEKLSKAGYQPHILERAYRNTPLTDAQKASNKAKSKVRARIEHVFGTITMSMGGLVIHTIGLARAVVKITLKNLSYNMKRFTYLQGKLLETKAQIA